MPAGRLVLGKQTRERQHDHFRFCRSTSPQASDERRVSNRPICSVSLSSRTLRLISTGFPSVFPARSSITREQRIARTGDPCYVRGALEHRTEGGQPMKQPPTAPSRRALLLAAASAPFLARGGALAQDGSTAPRPFRVDVPQATIDRILTRVREARWPARLDANDWRYGANWDYMKSLAQYWTEKFDWRKAEANLNRYPQFVTRLGDYDIHFYHVRGRGTKPMPLILTHGWPGSTFEFLEAIGP